MDKELFGSGPHGLLDFAIEISKHDNRIDRCKKHDGRTIAFVTLCAVLSGFRGWEEIGEYGKCKQSLMEEYLGPLDGMPSHDTISRFFSLLKPESFEGVYREWILEIFRLRSSPPKDGGYRDQIAVDGKEMCGARDDSPVRMVSAYAVKSGISLGQKKVEEKTNEIPALQELVAELDVSDCIVTADAMHCQKKTCKAIIEGGGNFFLFAKGNQEKLKQAVKEAVEVAMAHPRNNNDRYKTIDKPDGKGWWIRQCIAVGEPLYLGRLHKEWPELHSFGIIISERPGEKEVIREERYFITSLKMNAELFLQTARNHWAVENGLHWRLDVDFQEDKSRKKKNAAINFSLINKMAMAILSFDKKKEPLRRKRQRAALKEEYLKQLLGKLEEIL